MVLKGKYRVLLYGPQPLLLAAIVMDRLSRHETQGIQAIIIVLGVFAIITSTLRAWEAWKYER